MPVTIKYLSNVMTTAEVVGQTVGEVRSRYQGAFSMPADVSPFVNGESASSSDVLEDGDEIEFRKAHGEKGN
jgi:hypothetical protein